MPAPRSTAALNGTAPWPTWGAVAVVGGIPAIWRRFHWPAVELQSLRDLRNAPGAAKHLLAMWGHVGHTDEPGRDHIFATKRIAIATIFDRLDRTVCARCAALVFEECQALPPRVA